MTKSDKLEVKLMLGSIDGKELRTLLKQRGWHIDRVRGSHEIWICGSRTFVLATHGKDLKQYQIREAQNMLHLKRRE
jgi:predicted RNA binding protein YcfA (HicA-like mRNA interferase family)